MADRESRKEQLEREHGELLKELRSLIPGAEVLFGFLLAIRFTGQFDVLDDIQRYVYYVTLIATAVALVLLLAPAAHHRLRFREGDKDFMLRKGNREAIVGTVAIALALPESSISSPTSSSDRRGDRRVDPFFAFLAWRWWSLALIPVALRQGPQTRRSIMGARGRGRRQSERW